MKSIDWKTTLISTVLAVAVFFAFAFGMGLFDHYEEPSLEAQQENLLGLLSDGQFDTTFLQAELSGSDLSVLSEHIRDVHIVATLYFTKQEIFERLNAQNPERYQTIDDMPQEVLDQFNADGLLPYNFINTQQSGFLANDLVVLASPVIQQIGNTDSDTAKRITVQITLLANPEIEDAWKQETLFEGTAEELFSSNSLNMANEYGIAIITRPDNKVLTISESNAFPVNIADLSEVKTGNLIIFGSESIMSSGTVFRVVEERGLFSITGNFQANHLGAPVFVLRDGVPHWVGLIVSIPNAQTAVVVSPEAVQTQTKEK